MNVKHFSEVKAEEVYEGAKGVKIRWVISEKTGAPNFSMRHFEIAPGGHTPEHSHPFEHEIFILEGDGVVKGDGGEKPLKPGDAVFIRPGEVHQFRNSGGRELKLLCMVPSKDRCSL